MGLFAQSGFFGEVAAALYDYGIEASSLRVEITESAAVGPGAMDTCVRLAEKGVYLYLDDFGTGYSSLSYLTRMPIRALKIDRSFVARVLEDRMSASIVASVVALAAALGLETVAEGVESVAEVELLRQMNCQNGQGYLGWRPLDAEVAAQLLANPLPRPAQIRVARPSEAPLTLVALV